MRNDHYNPSAKQPTIILIGENHYSSWSMLVELTFAHLLYNLYDCRSVGVECTQESIDRVKKGISSFSIDALDFEETSNKLDIKLKVLGPVIPLEQKQLNRIAQFSAFQNEALEATEKELKAISKVNNVSEQEQRRADVRQTIDALEIATTFHKDTVLTLRDQKMTEAIADAAKNLRPEQKFLMAIVGQDHLRGIATQLRQQDWEIVVVATNEERYARTSPWEQTARFFAADSTDVYRLLQHQWLPKEIHCDLVGNLDLLEVATNAWRHFLGALQNQFNDEYARIFAGLFHARFTDTREKEFASELIKEMYAIKNKPESFFEKKLQFAELMDKSLRQLEETHLKFRATLLVNGECTSEKMHLCRILEEIRTQLQRPESFRFKLPESDSADLLSHSVANLL